MKLTDEEMEKKRIAREKLKPFMKEARASGTEPIKIDIEEAKRRGIEVPNEGALKQALEQFAGIGETLRKFSEAVTSSLRKVGLDWAELMERLEVLSNESTERVEKLRSLYDGEEKEKLEILIDYLGNNLGLADFVEALISIEEDLKTKSLDQVIEEFEEVIKELSEEEAEEDQSKESAKEMLEHLEAVKATKFYITNSKPANYLTDKDNYSEAGQELNVSKQGSKHPIYTATQLRYEGDDLNYSRELTNFDKVVHDAVCSLYEAGNESFTVNMVIRALKGTDEGSISETQRESIRESIEKSRRTRLYIDYTEEAKARGYDVTKTVVDDTLLSAECIMVETGGQKVEAYKFNTKPILYKYCQLSKQIISVPARLLNISGYASNTNLNMTIKAYLIRRIESMKRSKKLTNVITYEAIFKNAGADVSDKKEKSKRTKDIKSILDHFRDSNLIQNYEEMKTGRTKTGVKIFY